ncbi:hypothetical protein PROFUN_06406 [Planoprotostelium fungivorum]|uniref:Uncharacterized protein n=1 Tax=Planoprotostelium fungivorum TaxID=1890364 RepID=A0A2P6NNS9_9EUKA|nr:hypothetical protein PROFUN_06406 [Planoprotostelium fungivorum]
MRCEHKKGQLVFRGFSKKWGRPRRTQEKQMGDNGEDLTSMDLKEWSSGAL